MQTPAPTWRTIMDSFQNVHLTTIKRAGKAADHLGQHHRADLAALTWNFAVSA
jgi:hypothetical protein